MNVTLLRCIAFSFLLSIGGAAHASASEWFPVNRELGCVPFSDLASVYPILSETRSPSGVLKVMKERYPNAKAMPFLELLELEHGVDGEAKAKAEANPAYAKVLKLYTKENAIYVSWGQDESAEGELFYTSELCKAMFGKGAADGVSRGH